MREFATLRDMTGIFRPETPFSCSFAARVGVARIASEVIFAETWITDQDCRKQTNLFDGWRYEHTDWTRV